MILCMIALNRTGRWYVEKLSQIAIFDIYDFEISDIISQRLWFPNNLKFHMPKEHNRENKNIIQLTIFGMSINGHKLSINFNSVSREI